MENRQAVEPGDCAPPAQPLTRARTVKLLSKGAAFSEYLLKKHSSEKLLDILERYIAPMVDVSEWFDFGDISPEVLHDTARNAVQLLAAGVFRPPFDNCVFRVRIGGTKPIEWAYVVVHVEGEWIVSINHAAMVDGGVTEIIGINDIVRLRNVDGDVSYVCAMTDDEIAPHIMAIVSLWMILNTRGVPRTVEKRDPRADSFRERKNLPRRGNVTRIQSTTFVEALRETVNMERGGSRSSPRPHLRRGHHRRLQGRDKPIWVHPSIVNGSEDVRWAMREKYAVSTDAV